MNKQKLRETFLLAREKIKPKRRLWAAEDLVKWFECAFGDKGLILSFCPTRAEIDTDHLNLLLAKKKRLVLPRVIDDKLLLFLVENLDEELTIGPFGILEPDARRCPQIESKELSAALVPGLAFDARRHRLGYGKGYFDRLLEGRSFSAYGIGFLEQFSKEDLPDEPHDQKLDDIKLF